MNRILRIAHRGASGYAPENTLAAFEKALELESDMIELDVRKTFDGKLVVFHDLRLDRLTHCKGFIRNVTFDELKKHKVQGHDIPLLYECLGYLKGKCQINIEIKARGLAEDLAFLIKKLNMTPDVVISSFFHTELIKIKAIDQNFRVALLLATRPLSVRTVVKLAKRIQAEALHISYELLNRKYIIAARSEGLKIHIWTVDEPEDIFQLKTLGVDGIFSNYPDRI